MNIPKTSTSIAKLWFGRYITQLSGSKVFIFHFPKTFDESYSGK